MNFHMKFEIQLIHLGFCQVVMMIKNSLNSLFLWSQRYKIHFKKIFLKNKLLKKFLSTKHILMSNNC